MRKAQVTVFVIISLVIITMVGVAYYMIGSMQTEKAEEQISRQQVSATRIDPLKEYIKSCLSITSAQGFELLGKQGGYIYRSQGGIIPDPAPENYSEYQMAKVHYGIYAPLSDVGTIFFANPPQYPFPTFPVIYHPDTGEVVFQNYMKGYYGRNKIPPIFKPRQNSIQEQLEKFTVNGTLECLDWSDFERQGLNITAEGEPNITVEFAESDVSFHMGWPIKVEDKGTGATTEISEFIIIYPVRFEKIHNFATFLMDLDVSNISFDVRATDGEISSYIQPDVEAKDDMVKVVDSMSNILGEEYEFRFMRENRPPALYYINESAVKGPLCNRSTIAITGKNNLTFIDSCGLKDFNLTFRMIDPDEETLGFNYTLLFYGTLPKAVLSTSHTILDDEADLGKIGLNVSVTDGQHTDWQVINISTVMMD